MHPGKAGGGAPEGGWPDAMITFYCDDSGKAAHDEYVHAVAYIGLEPRWQQFSSTGVCVCRGPG